MKIKDNWASACIDFLEKLSAEDDTCIYALASHCYEYEQSDFDGLSSVAKEYGNDDLSSYIERIKCFWEADKLPDYECLKLPSIIQARLLNKKSASTRKRIKDSLAATISGYQEYQVVKAVVDACIDAAVKQLSATRLVEDARSLAQEHLAR